MTPTDEQTTTGADGATGAAGSPVRVVIVGGGFAGLGCARELASTDVEVTLIDRNNYHQFQPLLYQVATAQIASDDVGTPLRNMFRGDANVDVKQAEVTEVDVATRTVTTADGLSWTGDYLVWRWAPSRTSTAPPEPRSTACRCTRCSTPSACAPASSRCSTPPTGIPGSSTGAR
jgi:NADPH-dependent 2,4-dienoyl-CoA reductase/sulfur reductase-like enzyme